MSLVPKTGSLIVAIRYGEIQPKTPYSYRQTKHVALPLSLFRYLCLTTLGIYVANNILNFLQEFRFVKR